MTDAILVLVVEDELLIREALTDALEDGGYQVLADSGGESLTKIEKYISTCAALVTDINLSGTTTTGWEIGKKARELKNDIPVIYITAASAHEWPSHGVPNSVLLTKPFAAAQVVTAVSQLLNEAAQLKAATGVR